MNLGIFYRNLLFIFCLDNPPLDLLSWCKHTIIWRPLRKELMSFYKSRTVTPKHTSSAVRTMPPSLSILRIPFIAPTLLHSWSTNCRTWSLEHISDSVFPATSTGRIVSSRIATLSQRASIPGNWDDRACRKLGS